MSSHSLCLTIILLSLSSYIYAAYVQTLTVEHLFY